MSSVNDRHIAVLNGLIETTLDSADGYKEAANSAKNPAFKTLFERRSMERHQLTAELQAEVRRLGGEPADDGTTLAAAHRMFLNLKNAVTGSDESVVNEVEAGEDHIKAKFEDALAGGDLPAPVRETVTRVYARVKEGHDQMSGLKHSLAAH